MSNDRDDVLADATQQRIKLWQQATSDIQTRLKGRPITDETAIVVIDLADEGGWRVATAIVARDETGEMLSELRTCRDAIVALGDSIPVMVLATTIDEAVTIAGTTREKFDERMRTIRSGVSFDLLVGVVVAAGGAAIFIVPRRDYTGEIADPFGSAPIVGSA